jgi:hypothetical protein
MSTLEREARVTNKPRSSRNGSWNHRPSGGCSSGSSVESLGFRVWVVWFVEPRPCTMLSHKTCLSLVFFAKSVPAQIRQFILDFSQLTGSVDEFEGQLTFAKWLCKHFLWDKTRQRESRSGHTPPLRWTYSLIPLPSEYGTYTTVQNQILAVAAR